MIIESRVFPVRKITPADRNALLPALGRLGWDDRPGVGLDEHGRPDILWLPVPDQAVPAYYIACYPVTHAQFQAFIDAEDGYADPRWWVDFAERQCTHCGLSLSGTWYDDEGYMYQIMQQGNTIAATSCNPLRRKDTCVPERLEHTQRDILGTHDAD